MAEIKDHEWFNKAYSPSIPADDEEDNTCVEEDAVLTVDEVRI